MADLGLKGFLLQRQAKGATSEQLALTLKIHEKVASEHGAIPRTEEIKRLIGKYRGLMVQFIVPFRKRPPEVTKARRSEFGLNAASIMGTRAHFLQSCLKDPDLVMELYRRGIPLGNLQAMSRGSFGQEAGSRDPNLLSVDHMVPLVTGDNFDENFAVVTVGVNLDLAMLLEWQTGFLPYDDVRRSPKEVRWRPAPTVDIITLRPRLINYAKDKTFPGFVAHQGWSPRKPTI